jgi:hypothetical protein
MLISKDLPIDRDRFAQNDQILTITGTNWLDYQNFNSQEDPGYRVSYFKGEITIVSPGRNHERIVAAMSISEVKFHFFPTLKYLLDPTQRSICQF